MRGLLLLCLASTPRNRATYERRGFAVTEELALGKGTPPPQWRMWRAPRAVRSGPVLAEVDSLRASE